MANTKDTTPATVSEAAEVETAESAPKTRGRKATRDPNGKSISGFFSADEMARIKQARFKGEHEQLNDLVRTATLQYVDGLLSE